MRIVTGVVTAVLITGVLAVSPATGPASAAPLGISNVEDLVVDQAHGRVYVSGGALATADLTATPTGTVAGIADARQMTLTPDGGQLVVADGDGLTVVDAATATVLGTIPTGTNSCPDAVAPAAGKVFFSYGDCTGGTPGLGAVDLGTDTVTKNIATGTVVLAADQAVVLKSVAATPNMLVLRAGPTLAIFDATVGSTPSVTLRVSKSFSPSLQGSVAVDPSGTEVVAGGQDGIPLPEFSTADLSAVRSYPSSEPEVAAFRSDGRLALSSGLSTAVSTFSSTGTFVSSVNVLTGYNRPRALGYGSQRLYVAASDDSAEPVVSVVLAPVGPPAALTIGVDHAIRPYKGTATVTITLTSPTTSSTVSLWAQAAGHTRRLVKTASVSSSTRKLVVKVPGLTYDTRFQATFAGDDDFLPGSSAFKIVRVRSRVVMASVSTSVTSDGYHRLKGSPSPIVSATLSPLRRGVCIQVSAIVLVQGHWLDFGSAKCIYTTSSGRITVRLIGFRPGTKLKITTRAAATSTNIESLWTSYRVMIA